MTQWLAGNGDGVNGVGPQRQRHHRRQHWYDVRVRQRRQCGVADGYEKIAHYFDHNQDGVVRDGEMDGLMLWVDDGDADKRRRSLTSSTASCTSTSHKWRNGHLPWARWD